MARDSGRSNIVSLQGRQTVPGAKNAREGSSGTSLIRPCSFLTGANACKLQRDRILALSPAQTLLQPGYGTTAQLHCIAARSRQVPLA